MLNNEKTELVAYSSIAALAVFVFSFVLFELTGVRVIAGIILISFPFYLILDKFRLTEGEKSVFSILLGLTIFPSLVYLLGLVISFRIAIIATFLVSVIAAFLMAKYKSKKQS